MNHLQGAIAGEVTAFRLALGWGDMLAKSWVRVKPRPQDEGDEWGFGPEPRPE